MIITFPILRLFRALTAQTRPARHPEALQESRLNIARRIDDPATLAMLACELLSTRREGHHACTIYGRASPIRWTRDRRNGLGSILQLLSSPDRCRAQANRATGSFVHPLASLCPRQHHGI